MQEVVVGGVQYTSKYITDQELAVVESMRQGAYVSVIFHDSEIDAAISQLQTTPLEVFNKRRITDLTDDTKNSFICVGMETNDSKVEINHYVNATRKSEVIV